MKGTTTIWVGLDVHAATIAIARLDGAETTPKTSEIPNDGKALARLMKKLKSEGDVRVCYEAGPCGFEVHRQLTALGVPCVVIAPSLIPSKPGERVKTDRRDAVKLARLYRAGELTPIWVPTEEQEGVRDVLRARDDVRKDLTAARHRLTKFLLRHGKHYTSGTNWTGKFWAWVRDLSFARATERLVFEHYVDRIRDLEHRLARLDKEVVALAQTKPYAERVQRFAALRGFSVLRAMVVLTELYDLRRFDHPRQLMAYLGLVPSEYSSGGREKRGKITKTGNAHVRRALVEAAWAYRKRASITARQNAMLDGQPPAVAKIVQEASARLTSRYGRLVARGKKNQLAVTAVARELAGHLWALEALPLAA